MGALRKKAEDLFSALDRLSRREKFLVGGLTICFLIFLAVLLSLWISSTLEAIERRIADKSGKLQTIIDMRQQYEAAQEREKQISDLVQKGRDIDVVATLGNLERQLGLNIEDLATRTPAINVEQRIEEIRVEVNIPRITIDRLVEMLEEIERRAQTIAVRTLSIRNNFRDPSQLDVNMTVSNFQQMKEAPPSPGSAASKQGN